MTTGAQANIILTLLLLPMSFLGCVYFSWSDLSHVPILQYIALFDPQTYISELFRGTLTSQPHIDFFWSLGGIVVMSVLFTFLGLRAFVRRAVN